MWFLSEIEIKHKDIIDKLNNYIGKYKVQITSYKGSDGKYLGLGISNIDYDKMIKYSQEIK